MLIEIELPEVSDAGTGVVVWAVGVVAIVYAELRCEAVVTVAG